MKLMELINKLIPEKVQYFGLTLGVVGLLIVGVMYEFTVAVGAVVALIFLFKNGIMDKLK